MSADTVFVLPSPFGALALTRSQLADAQALARELLPPEPQEQQASAVLSTEVATAEQMAKRTHTPASWWLEAARRGTVPHLRVGKYPRFVVAEVLAALHTSSGAGHVKNEKGNQRA